MLLVGSHVKLLIKSFVHLLLLDGVVAIISLNDSKVVLHWLLTRLLFVRATVRVLIHNLAMCTMEN